MKQQVVLEKLREEPVIGKGMIGFVVSHPTWKPGTEVGTTNVIAINEDGTIETKNSIYTIKKR